MIKTYEEFDFFRKEYNDYLGLDDINALDEFNEIAGNRYENIINIMIEKDKIKWKNDVAYNYVELYFQNFYGEWIEFGSIIDNKFTPRLSKIKPIEIFLKKLKEEHKDSIIKYLENIEAKAIRGYSDYMKRIKKLLTTRREDFWAIGNTILTSFK